MPDKKRQFIWTVVPAGRVETVGTERLALFSVLLTPRLIGPGTLALADFGMQSWPERLAVAKFDPTRAGRSVGARRMPLTTADGQRVAFAVAEQLAAWKSLFGPASIVRSYQPTSYGERPVHEFPASEAAAQVSAAYGDSARALATLDGAGEERGREREAVLGRIAAEWQAGLWPDPARLDEASPLRRAFDFYQRPTSDFTPLRPLAERASEPLDFHQIITRIADHPMLLRCLGLLLDFGVPVANLGGSGPAELVAAPQWPSPDTPPPGWSNAVQEDVAPRTAYVISGSRFLPAGAKPGDAAQGMLPLAGTSDAGGARFEIMPFDVDGAALRMVSIADAERDDPRSDSAAGLPALRSMGFALVEKTRREQHVSRIARARERSTVAGLLASPLSAEHLAAGFRVDIFDQKTMRWRSLCQRRIGYMIGGVAVPHDAAGAPAALLEEGWIRPDSVATGAGAADALYLHQIVARWDGWSVVAPRPERVVDPAPEPEPPFHVTLEPESGSLPRLLFGRQYRMRVRLADIAGGGLRLDQASASEQQTELITHRRFEPIPAPELLPTRAWEDAAAQDVLVVRTDGNRSAETFAAAHGYRAFDLRYLFAPRSALELAMQYEGTFDGAFGPSVLDAEIHRCFDRARRADRDIGDAGAVLIEGGNNSPDYFVVPETPVVVPWLPDPGSNLVAVSVRSRPIDPETGRPGAVSGFYTAPEQELVPFRYAWKGVWPDLMPIALRVIGAASGCTASMQVTGNLRTLAIALGPAEQVTLDVVSCPVSDEVPSIGVAHWAGATDSTDNPVNKHVYCGKNPLVTPPRTITAVHAVQTPMKVPSGRLTAKRQVDETSAVLGTRELSLHIPSTGRIDIDAEWTELRDIPPAPRATTIMKANVGSFDVMHKPLPDAISEIRQQFEDTRRRRITYKVKAVSRFHRYFGRITALDSQACTVQGTLETTDLPSSARPPAPVVRHTMPAFRWSREGDGTSVIRSIRRAGIIRLFMERPWFVSGEDEGLAVLAWSRHPAAPRQPTMQWLSLAGRDPTWDTGKPGGVLRHDQFNVAPADRRDVALRECPEPVSAVVHRVEFDNNADCWFADVDLSPLAASSYWPFVRLGVARYQETEDPLDRISPPVLCEPVQILPRRDLTIRRAGARATVTVSGMGPGGATSTAIQAELQVFEGPQSLADDALIGSNGWRTLALRKGVLDNDLDLDLPEAGSRQLRICVTEMEPYPTADSSGSTIPSRLVYADTVRL